MCFELTACLKIPFEQQNFTMYDITQAEKFLLGSSDGCALPVREVDGILAKASVPGHIIQRLMEVYVEETGFEGPSAISAAYINGVE